MGTGDWEPAGCPLVAGLGVFSFGRTVHTAAVLWLRSLGAVAVFLPTPREWIIFRQGLNIPALQAEQILGA